MPLGWVLNNEELVDRKGHLRSLQGMNKRNEDGFGSEYVERVCLGMARREAAHETEAPLPVQDTLEQRSQLPQLRTCWPSGLVVDSRMWLRCQALPSGTLCKGHRSWEVSSSTGEVEAMLI